MSGIEEIAMPVAMGVTRVLTSAALKNNNNDKTNRKKKIKCRSCITANDDAEKKEEFHRVATHENSSRKFNILLCSTNVSTSQADLVYGEIGRGFRIPALERKGRRRRMPRSFSTVSNSSTFSDRQVSRENLHEKRNIQKMPIMYVHQKTKEDFAGKEEEEENAVVCCFETSV